MIGIPQKNLYEYLLQDWKEVELALAELVQSKDVLAGKGVLNLDKLFRYIVPLYDMVTAGVKNPQWLWEQNILKFLSVDLIKSFLANPTNAEIREALSVQLVMVYTATGHQTEIEPYSAEEIQQLVEGKLSYYNDLLFVHTLFNLILKPGAKDSVQALAGMLRSEGGTEFGEANDWEVVFLLSLVIYALWVNLDYLEEDFQDLLIKNYFYIAIIAGVPIRSLAVRFAFSGTAEEVQRKTDLMTTDLLESREKVPLNLQTGEVKNLSEILKNYVAQLSGEKSSSFTQEEFIKEFYTNQPGREIWRGWLRELLVTMNHLSAY